MPGPPIEVTVSGIPRARRHQLQQLIERLRGSYSGALNVGRTAAVVVEGAVDWSAPKLQAAAANCIPVVCVDWLLDSSANGFLLNPAKYAVPAQQGRRSSAESTSQMAAPSHRTAVVTAAPASAACGVATKADAPAAPVALEMPLHRAMTPTSPEVLRGEASPPPTGLLAAPFMERSPASAPRPNTGSPEGTLVHHQEQGMLQELHAAKLPEPLPSPASPSHQRTACQGSAALPSPQHYSLPPLGEPDLPLDLPMAGGWLQSSEKRAGAGVLRPGGAQAAQDKEIVTFATAANSDSEQQQRQPQQDGQVQQDEDPQQAGGSQQTTRPAISGAGCGSVGQDVAATPQHNDAGTDSDTKIARFLSRMPHVTLARGTCQPRRRLSTVSPCRPGPDDSPLGSLSGRGTAERPEGGRRGSFCSGEAGRQEVQMEQVGSEVAQYAAANTDGDTYLACEEQQKGLQELLDAAGTNAGRAGSGISLEASGASPDMLGAQDGGKHSMQASPKLRPPPSSCLRRWYTESVRRRRQPSPGVEEERSLPATTLIRLGPELQKSAAPSTLEGIAERHFRGQTVDEPGSPRGITDAYFKEGGLFGDGSQAFTMHASATAVLEGGQEILFVAGDTTHGARMLYDILNDGNHVHALALIQSIYRVADEVWMEHRYLLSKQDILERPDWAAALQGHCLADGELLLSMGSYHSPMHLISGEFWLSFPGRARLAKAGQGARQQDAGTACEAPCVTTYTCRKGFDVSARALLPVRRALEGLSAAGA